ncbi:MAG TPA: ferritin-like domain-containing protein [Kineosporiaceae bacterium]
MRGEHAGLRRQRVIMVVAVVVSTALAVGGCTSSGGGGHGAAAGSTSHSPSPDELAAGRAVLAARSLVAQLAAFAAARPAMAALVGQLLASHRQHLSALGLPDPSPSGASPAGSAAGGSPTGSDTWSAPADATPPAAPGVAAAGAPSGPPSAADLVAAERAAALQTLGDVLGTTPGTAGLLARIAGALAANADLVAAAAGLPAPGELMAAPGGPSRTAPDGAWAAALSNLLAGEHAAVFAYGLITARATADRQVLARTLWEAHRVHRDQLQQRIAAAGLTPPEAEPGYDVGPPPTTPDQVAALAARVEDGLAAVALGAVTTTTGAVRVQLAADLVAAARRAAGWRGTPDALPG